MRILLIPDELDGWSAHSRCKQIQRRLKDHTVDIVAGDRITDMQAVAQGYDVVHFNYTGKIDRHYSWVMNNLKKTIITVINERSLFEAFDVDVPKFTEMCKSCAHTLALSPRVAEALGCEHVNNGVDTEMFIPKRRTRVGYVGTQMSNKNWGIIPKACGRLDMEFVPQFYDKRIPQEQMHEYYENIDVLVHPSLTEAFSNVIVEALACNVPVICTNAGVAKQLDAYVTIIDPNEMALYDALKRFAGRVHMAQAYDWDKICKRYKEIYERVYADQRA